MLTNHTFKRNKKEFIKKRTNRTSPPLRLTGEQIWEWVQDFLTVIENSHDTIFAYGSTHKWTKRSIFWDLSYWKVHLIHHNLDVIHIEKNDFDDIINTVINVTRKIKDNLNARNDMRDICDQPTLDVDASSKGPKPKAVYTLDKE